jgi:S1-C subfamily serine protease/tetratricopeptide (TPR) repeat protein
VPRIAHSARSIAACFGACLIARPAVSEPKRDLPLDESTTSPPAAKKIHAAESRRAAGQLGEALGLIREAEKLDPDCQFTWYLESIILEDQGDLAGAVEAARKAAVYPGGKDRMLKATVEYSLGLMLAAMKKGDESNHWLSRAIVDAPSQIPGHEISIMYTTMARNLRARKEIGSAVLAATLAAAFDSGRDADAVFNESLSKAEEEEAQREDVARALFLDDALPQIPERADTGLKELRSVESESTPTRILADRQGKHMVVLGRSLDSFGVLNPGAGATLQWHRVGQMSSRDRPTIVTGYLSDTRLFLVTRQQRRGRLLEVDLESGVVKRTWELGDNIPTSLVVVPSHGVALFPAHGLTYSLSLEGGRLVKAQVPADEIASDAEEKRIYTSWKHYLKGHSEKRRMVIGGVPVTVEDHQKIAQTLLFQMYLSDDRVVLSQARDKAAADASEIVVSPEGRWVSLPGTGGWHPTTEKGGSVLPVYSGADFSHVQSQIDVGSGARGVCFNPVTNQVAVVREREVLVVHLRAGAVEKAIPGSFSGACAWSGDGRTLALGESSARLRLFENVLSPAEADLSVKWWQSVLPADQAVAPASDMPELATFRLLDDPLAAAPAIQHRIEQARDVRMPPWEQLEDYRHEAALFTDLQAILNDKVVVSPGIRIYKFESLRQRSASYPPVAFFLGDAYAGTGQADKAAPLLVEVVQQDRGRTELTTRALVALGAEMLQADRKVAAAYAFSTGWLVSRRQKDLYRKLTDLLASLGMTEANAALRGAASPVPAMAAGEPGLPVLAVPAAGPKLSAADVFIHSVPSTVLVKVPSGFGSGVCVALGVVVTSNHVVDGTRDITLEEFLSDAGAARRGREVKAHVVLADADQDLAVLRVSEPAPELKPMPVAAASPGAGERVFAIGNPGLGGQSLDLTISEGIVSARDRIIEGNTYIQHTAATNRGNSGGPLINERGELVGIVSRVAIQMANVAFATPVEQVRALFPAAMKPDVQVASAEPRAGTGTTTADAADTDAGPPAVDGGTPSQTSQPSQPASAGALRRLIPSGCGCADAGASSLGWGALLMALYSRRLMRRRVST